MTTTQTQPRFTPRAFFDWLKARIQSRDFKSQMNDSADDMARDFRYVGGIVTTMLFTMFFSAILAMGTAYLVAFPGGLAGWIASLAVASGMGLEAFLPAFAFSLVILFGFLLFFLHTVQSWFTWQDEQQDDLMFDADDIMSELLSLRELVEELKRTDD